MAAWRDTRDRSREIWNRIQEHGDLLAAEREAAEAEKETLRADIAWLDAEIQRTRSAIARFEATNQTVNENARDRLRIMTRHRDEDHRALEALETRTEEA